jgi:probable rRNA maturation factor
MPSSVSSKIRFFYQDTRPALKDREKLKSFLVTLFKKEGKQLGSLNYIFCTDRALLNINRQYLQHDFYTDIITFDLSETNSKEGEIYISIDRVRENARQLGHSIKSELLRVIFHGALHLCGYGDKSGKEKQIMRKREDFYLTLWKKQNTGSM